MAQILERHHPADQRNEQAVGLSPKARETTDSPSEPNGVGFPYDEAFSRNIGWVTREEQQLLRGKRIAIAGLGGVGGVHLLTLARLGIGHFRVADFDTFDFANFNRQIGATVSSVGLRKSQVLEDMARDINPGVDLEVFSEGVTEANIDAFLEGVDLYVDALDFFAFDARALVFATCARKGIPAITVAPLGMGAALMNFLPGQMSFEEYFRWEGCDETEKALRFMVGLSPAFLHAKYLADPTAVDFWGRRGPSTGMACQLCAGVAGTEALKILLGRGEVVAAPRGIHFDAYRNTLRRTWRPWGNANPIQRLALMFVRHRYAKTPTAQPSSRALNVGAVKDESPFHASGDLPVWKGRRLEDIPTLVLNADSPALPAWQELLDAARWAPSGDNTQPWRFEIVSADHLVVHGFDTRHWCVYDIDGRPSRIAIGAMLETLKIAASEIDVRLEVTPRRLDGGPSPVFDVLRLAQAGPRQTALNAVIRSRTVQRRPLSTQPLSAAQKAAIEQAVAAAGPFRCVWMEGFAEKWRAAGWLSASSRIRMTLAQAHATHERVIDWHADHSEDRIPASAIGLDPVTLRIMRWALGSQRRALFMARYLGGTILPRLQLDWMPAIGCGAHLAILPDAGATPVADDFAMGAAVQRAWLTAASLGLMLQPEMAGTDLRRLWSASGSGACFVGMFATRPVARRGYVG